MPAIAAQFEEELRVWTETTSMLGDREIKVRTEGHEKEKGESIFVYLGVITIAALLPLLAKTLSSLSSDGSG